MAVDMYKQVEEFQRDYDKIFEKGKWEPCDYTTMKDLQKLMYYIEVRDAMKNGGDYPGSEYMDQNSYNRGYSYARGGNRMHNPMNGRFMSRGGSGTYPMGNGPWYYDDGMSGRRYYDSVDMAKDREDAIHKLHKAMDSESNPEFRMAIQEAIHTLEAK